MRKPRSAEKKAMRDAAARNTLPDLDPPEDDITLFEYGGAKSSRKLGK